ncbi:unnamed protein product [Cuscuta epithymum]|uniref:Uncharacterized protein n=1 Tax=Cuscuta epithymum TaxID=186058 RepID=A0AAV0DVU0_9ASTE|nr:unnamed protein product [Cuscuta epithymum]
MQIAHPSSTPALKLPSSKVLIFSRTSGGGRRGSRSPTLSSKVLIFSRTSGGGWRGSCSPTLTMTLVLGIRGAGDVLRRRKERQIFKHKIARATRAAAHRVIRSTQAVRIR